MARPGCRRVVGGLCLSLVVVPMIALLAASSGSPAVAVSRVNFMMMCLFRDLARVKARRRRFGQPHALMPVLMGREDPLPLGDASAGLSLTVEELAEFDGRPLSDRPGETAALLLSVKGRIYDVTAGAAHYGPGRSYHKLVGKDATRAFCTGCLEPACLIANTEGLKPEQVREGDRWIEMYEHHDKYKLVGQLREPSPDGAGSGGADADAELAAAAAWERERLQAAEASERSKKHKPFRPR